MNAYIYQTERYLIEKIVEQKEITRNRIEFLNGEVNFAISSLREIQSKINKIEKMKEQENKNMIRTALDKLDREILENRKR
jgi:pyridoxal biosynthesis lyase PdxS